MRSNERKSERQAKYDEIRKKYGNFLLYIDSGCYINPKVFQSKYGWAIEPYLQMY